MELPGPNFRVTPYGDVDAKQLEWLQENFETTSLLHLVDQLDEFQTWLQPNGGIRDELLQLHGMANSVLNNAPLTRPSDGQDIWEAASELGDDLQQVAAFFLQAAEVMKSLAALRPDQED